MSDFRQLQQFRDDVHKKIIRTVISLGMNIKGKYRVLVSDPVTYQIPGKNSELTRVAGIDGNTSELIDPEFNFLRYQDVPVEQLEQVLSQLEKNRFKISQ